MSPSSSQTVKPIEPSSPSSRIPLKPIKPVKPVKPSSPLSCQVVKHVKPVKPVKPSSPSSRQALKPVKPLSGQSHCKGESQPAGGHNYHKWRWMRRWGRKALPLLRQKRIGQGNRGLLGLLLHCFVPALWPCRKPSRYCTVHTYFCTVRWYFLARPTKVRR